MRTAVLLLPSPLSDGTFRINGLHQPHFCVVLRKKTLQCYPRGTKLKGR
jgi:hypothetical protein